MTARELDAQRIQKEWNESGRWKGIKRGYGPEDVVRLRGSMQIEHTLAKRGAEKLWRLLNSEAYVNTLGALTGNQAMQQVKAGLKAIYLSGWQVAGDANLAGEMYPDQSLYPVNSVPAVVRRINNTFARADQIQWMEGKNPSEPGYVDYFAPIVADAEAGFGGVLNAFELMKSMIEAGAAGVHFEDQLASVKKCGHMGGKVLVPTREAVAKLVAARLAADVVWRANGTAGAYRCRSRRLSHLRRRRERRAVSDGGAHRRRVFQVQAGPATGSITRSCVCAVRGSVVVRNGQTGPCVCKVVC